jgi:diaminohydroxyphosphoribosylaminopyrimidine deaminase/5-amino-6-(5-phosphoribosylamino)uracil reductase
MWEAKKLAERGRGETSPNPMVGAVVVKNGFILGKGYHEKAGLLHAEVVALRKAGGKARGADLYVTLEPCNFQGRTPPCTEEIIRAGVRKVYVGMKDPNPKVNGKGIAYLKEKGVLVECGFLQNELREMNEAYIKYITKKVPFVTLKLALSVDGRIADYKGNSKYLSSDESLNLAHQMRYESDAVMVGVETVIKDNPKLTVRLNSKKKVLKRVILDSLAKTPLNSYAVRTAEEIPTIIFVSSEAPRDKVEELKEKGVIVEEVQRNKGELDLGEVLKVLGSREIVSLLVEGGAKLASSFVKNMLWDKLVVFVTPRVLGGSYSLLNEGGFLLSKAPQLHLKNVRVLGRDVMLTYYREDICLQV